MRQRTSSLLLATLLFALASSAKPVPAPRIVDLTAADGTKLKATYFSAGKPGPGVLLLHQCNRQRKVWAPLAQALAESGLNVLTLDFRGFGESGGTPFDKLTPAEATQVLAEKFPADVDTAFQFLLSQPGVKRDVMGAGGASCGVNQSIQLARRHPEVKSLVVLSGSTDRDGRQYLRQAKLPLFMSAADDDGPTVEYMQWMFSLSSTPGNHFQRYAVGGHGIEMFAPHPELTGLVVDWFHTTLLKTPGRAASGQAVQEAQRGPNMLDLIDQPEGAVKAARMLAEARQRDPKASLFSEALVNQIGYEHLQSGDVAGAIEIFQLNVSGYPNSPNVYDSLSDAYLADGQNDLARENAEKALLLLASDTADPEARKQAIRDSAEQKLKQLGPAPRQ